MKLAPNYSCTLEEVAPNRYAIELRKNGTGKTKNFLVCTKSKERLLSHMDSLTEAICNDFMKGV